MRSVWQRLQDHRLSEAPPTHSHRGETVSLWGVRGGILTVERAGLPHPDPHGREALPVSRLRPIVHSQGRVAEAHEEYPWEVSWEAMKSVPQGLLVELGVSGFLFA